MKEGKRCEEAEDHKDVYACVCVCVCVYVYTHTYS